MKQLNEFSIPFIGLKLGKHQFEYQINKAFFEHFEYNEFESSDIKVSLVLDKKSTMLELSFKHNGTVNIPCDLTGEMFDLPVEGSAHLVVTFGDQYNDDNDELLILPHREHQITVEQIIFEMIALSVPLKRVHPGIADGTLKSDTLDKLNEILVTDITDNKHEEEENTDPRWDELKKLLTDK